MPEEAFQMMMLIYQGEDKTELTMMMLHSLGSPPRRRNLSILVMILTWPEEDSKKISTIHPEDFSKILTNNHPEETSKKIV